MKHKQEACQYVSADMHDRKQQGSAKVERCLDVLAEHVSAVAEQHLQPCSSSGIGLSYAAAPEIALEQNPIGLVVLHACNIEGVKAKHHIPQLLYDFARKLHVLHSVFLFLQ